MELLDGHGSCVGGSGVGFYAAIGRKKNLPYFVDSPHELLCNGAHCGIISEGSGQK